MLVVTNSSHLYEERRQFERQMGELITLVNEQTSCHHAIADSLAELKVLLSYFILTTRISLQLILLILILMPNESDAKQILTGDHRDAPILRGRNYPAGPEINEPLPE